jgi:hypothetical protein
MSFSHTHSYILFTRERQTQSSSSGSSPFIYGNFELDCVQYVARMCTNANNHYKYQIIHIGQNKIKQIFSSFSFSLIYVNNCFFFHRLIVSQIYIDRSCLFSKHDLTTWNQSGKERIINSMLKKYFPAKIFIKSDIISKIIWVGMISINRSYIKIWLTYFKWPNFSDITS